MRLALGEAWASPVSPLLTAGLNGPKAGCAHVCLVPSRAKWHSIAGNENPALYGRGAGIRAVQAGAGADVPYTGNCLMEIGRKKTKTSHKEEVEMTKPN